MKFLTKTTPYTASSQSRERQQAFFAMIVTWLWFGVVAGFGLDSFLHFSQGKVAYRPIVHLHALIFVSWMVLFTYQLLLVREGRLGIHKRLGTAMVGLVALMVAVGLLTTYQVDTFRASHPGTGDPTFFIVATTDILAFAVLACVGLSMRKHPDVHKRLMLLASIYITDAGFARLAPFVIVPLVHDPFLQTFLISYFFSDLAMIAMVIYDGVTGLRFHPAYVASIIFIGVVELLSTWMYASSPGIHVAVLQFLTR
jgi:hypothetical protein